MGSAELLVSAMWAAHPATRAAFALAEFGDGAFEMVLAGSVSLDRHRPADPLVAGQWCNVLPGY